MYDLRLFLDTHPYEKRAIEEYNMAANKAIAMKAHFEKLYGPLTLSDKDDIKEWTWIEGPWPWDNSNPCVTCEEGGNMHVGV